MDEIPIWLIWNAWRNAHAIEFSPTEGVLILTYTISHEVLKHGRFHVDNVIIYVSQEKK